MSKATSSEVNVKEIRHRHKRDLDKEKYSVKGRKKCTNTVLQNFRVPFPRPAEPAPLTSWGRKFPRRVRFG